MRVIFKDYYKILELETSRVSLDDIKLAYRTVAKKYHPDANPDNKAEAEATDQPFLVQITDDDPSIAYVLVRMPNPIGLLPLPLEGEYSKTIRTKLADGSEFVNVLHITPSGFRMEDANCEGHDCVNQGEVTLENREDRIL